MKERAGNQQRNTRHPTCQREVEGETAAAALKSVPITTANMVISLSPRLLRSATGMWARNTTMPAERPIRQAATAVPRPTPTARRMTEALAGRQPENRRSGALLNTPFLDATAAAVKGRTLSILQASLPLPGIVVVD